VTPVLVRDRVPEVVMGPPVKPVPLFTVVTVPVPPDAEMVMEPVLADRVIPVPAVMLVTPVLVMVTLPVFPLTEIPVPAKMPETAPPPPVTVIRPSGPTVIPEVESMMEG
jgi:hypothetical protein